MFVNLIKVGLVWFADAINKRFDPFEKLSYAYTQSLEELEQDFYKDIQDRFVKDGRFSYELPMPADHGDAALFQGLYTAMINTKFQHDCIEVRQANAALGEYFQDGILIRGIREDGTINDTTSNDSATGALLGLYSIWRRGTGEASCTVQRWADRIIDAGYALTDLAGKPTKYGKLEDGWKTDPLRMTLLLGILRLAHQTSLEGGSPFNPKYKEHYDRLSKRFRPILRYPKVRLLWLDTDYDTHRAAIHLHVLYGLTADTVYADGLARLARITDKEHNAWVKILCWPFSMDHDLSILNTFDVPTRCKGNIEATGGVTPNVKWGRHLRTLFPLPISRRGSQEFFWQRNMFSAGEWAGNKTAGVYHSGLDFLIAYWFGKRLGPVE